jgi:DNA polymerase-1
METLDADGVKNKYGVGPYQIADYLALRGDSVDNIVGVKGIGDKTAAQLLSEYNSIEQLILEADSIKQPKVKESIIAYKDQLIENKRLAVLTGEVDVAIEWEAITIQKPDESKLLHLLDELQFARIRERLVKQGFIALEDDVNDKTETIKFAVVQLSPDEAITKLDQSKETAVGFLEQYPDRLFLIQDEDKSINEIIVT